MPSGRFSYIKVPNEITKASFKLIDRLTSDLDDLEVIDAAIARRLVHTMGGRAVLSKLNFTTGVGVKAYDAIEAGGAIIGDVKMVCEGITRTFPHANPRILSCPIGDADVAVEAKERNITRAMVAMERMRPSLANSVVAIGNAPTALFRLLEGVLDEGWDKPAVIFGFPVGFIGAAESKLALMKEDHNIPYVTLKGRLGGSVYAVAAVNAILLHLSQNRQKDMVVND